MKRAKLSREEVLKSAAELIAGTIDVEKMEVDQSVDVRIQFANDFLKVCEKEKFPLTLSIGTWLNKDGARFSDDLKRIMEKMSHIYEFHDGIFIYACEHDLFANYCP